MRTLAIVNHKGGVGKTTLAANLGAVYADRGRRVLLLDLDPQASLTFSLISVEEWTERYAGTGTIKRWFDGLLGDGPAVRLADLTVVPRRLAGLVDDRLSLVPSHLDLVYADHELVVRLAGATPRQIRQNFLSVHACLRDALTVLADRFDYAIIDCPPSYSVLTSLALVAADFYLVPARPDYLSTVGVRELERHVAALVDDFNHFGREQGVRPIAPHLLGVVFNMVQFYAGRPIAAQEPYIAEIDREPGLRRLNTLIRDSKSTFGDLAAFGPPVALRAGGHGPSEQVRHELELLATEVDELAAEAEEARRAS